MWLVDIIDTGSRGYRKVSVVVGATPNVDDANRGGDLTLGVDAQTWFLTLVHNAQETRLGMWGPGSPYVSEWASAESVQWLWVESTSKEREYQSRPVGLRGSSVIVTVTGHAFLA